MESLNLQAIPYVSLFQYNAQDTLAEVKRVLAVMPQGKVLNLNNVAKALDKTLISGVQVEGAEFELPPGYYLDEDFKVLSQEEFDAKFFRFDRDEAVKAVGRPIANHVLEAVRPAIRGEVTPDGGNRGRGPGLHREFSG